MKLHFLLPFNHTLLYLIITRFLPQYLLNATQLRGHEVQRSSPLPVSAREAAYFK